MMDVHMVEQDLIASLTRIYDDGEAAAIAGLVMEHLTRMSRQERRSLQGEQSLQIASEIRVPLEQALDRLMLHQPVQYVIGEAWFLGMQLKVTDAVLIPRPETEELVMLALQHAATLPQASILDIGTGSGCIPIALYKRLQQASVTAVDISTAALAIAAVNAERHQAAIRFLELDILDEQQWERLDRFDIIISNPPYIPQNEFEQIDQHVREHEPSVALFVPEDDALLFYRRIAAFARLHLSPNGMMFFEVHQLHATATKDMLEATGFEAMVLKDLNDNERMIKAWPKQRPIA